MTEVALTTAVASIPGRRPSSSSDSRVMIDDDAGRLGDVDVDLGEQAVDLDLADDAAKAVAGAERSVAVGSADPLDLGRRDDTAVALVAARLDPAVAIPAPDRVDADTERTGGLADRVLLLRHCLEPSTARTSRDERIERRRPVLDTSAEPGTTARSALSRTMSREHAQMLGLARGDAREGASRVASCSDADTA